MSKQSQSCSLSPLCATQQVLPNRQGQTGRVRENCLMPTSFVCPRQWLSGLYWLLLLWMCGASPAEAREQIAMTQADGPIRVDGFLDEADWAKATPVNQFRQHAPTPGDAFRGSFEVRILQNEHAIFLGIEVVDGLPQPPATLAPRDGVPDRRFNLMLSTNSSLESALVIGVNALGRQQDFLWDKGSWKLEHNVFFTSRGHETDNGCEIELEIPFRSLTYPAGREQTWHVLYLADDPARGSYYAYPAVSDGAWFVDAQLLQRFSAELTGVSPPEASVGVSATGTLTGVQSARSGDDGTQSWTGIDPWYDALRPGGQVDFTFTPNFTLSLVGNPDFSDVESDVTQFDLNERFTWARGERRDFFIRDAQLFGDELETLYTRSMVQPVYGLRLTGTSGAASFGILQVLDRAPGYTLDWNATPGWNADDVEGAYASTTYARLKLQLSRADIGLLSTDKRLVGGSGSINSVNGLDLRLRLTPQLNVVAALQGSITTDSSQTARAGHRGLLSISMPSAPMLRWQLKLLDISQDFRAETAFLTDTGLTLLEGYVEHPLDFQGSLNRVMPRLGGYVRLERDGEQWDHAEGSTEFTVEGIHRVKGLVEVNRLWLATAESPSLWKGTVTYGMSSSAALGYQLKAIYGESWNWPTLSPAIGGVGEVTLTLRPRYDLFLDGSLVGAFNTPEGRSQEQAMNLRLKGMWQFRPGANLRIIEEASASSTWGEQWLNSSVLLHFQARIGTEAWLGYSERRMLPGWEASEHTIFFKLSGNLRN